MNRWRLNTSAHCCFTRSNLLKMGPLQFCLPVFLGIHRNPKWHFSIPAWNLIFFGRNAFIWIAMKVPFHDFIQNLSQAPSMCIFMWIKVNKWNYLKISHRNSKILFVLGFYEYLKRLEGKIRKCRFEKKSNNSIVFRYLPLVGRLIVAFWQIFLFWQ